MTNPATVVGSGWALVSAIISFVAWLVRYRKMVNLISGYDPDLYSDPDAVANWFGGVLLITGLAGVLVGITAIVFSDLLMALTPVFAGVILAGALTAIIGGRRFKKKE